jgi:outer membrane protein assembly factor BamB
MRVLALIALLAAQPQEWQEQWPQWRGPSASGVALGGDPPLRWDAATNVKWKTAIPGKGSSTPIIWGDRVFILTAVDTGREAKAADLPKVNPQFQTKTQPPRTYHQYIVLCLERASGKILWQQVAAEQVPHEGHHPTHSYAAGSPTTDGQHLWASFGSRGVFCYTVAGQKVWERDLGDMNTRLGWGEASTPVLHGDGLAVNWDHEGPSFLAMLDARTGAVRWRKDRDEPTSWSTPLVVEHKGRTQLIVSATGKIRAYDWKTGDVIWECGGMTVNTIPSPLLYQDKVICMSGYRGASAVAIPLDAQGDVSGKALWRHARGTPYVPSPILVGERLYFTQGNTQTLSCLEVKTGKPVFEQERLPTITSIYASPVAAQDRIYFTGRDGTTVVIKAGDKLEVLATNRLGEPVDASPAIVGKQLFLRSEKHVWCIEGK